jgi:hypothetical protein
MKECRFCHKQFISRTSSCPFCHTSGSVETLGQGKDPYEGYNEHFREHFNGRPRTNCRYCTPFVVSTGFGSRTS